SSRAAVRLSTRAAPSPPRRGRRLASRVRRPRRAPRLPCATLSRSEDWCLGLSEGSFGHFRKIKTPSKAHTNSLAPTRLSLLHHTPTTLSLYSVCINLCAELGLAVSLWAF